MRVFQKVVLHVNYNNRSEMRSVRSISMFVTVILLYYGIKIKTIKTVQSFSKLCVFFLSGDVLSR